MAGIPSSPPNAMAPDNAEQKMKMTAAAHIGLKASTMSLLKSGKRCLNSLMTPPNGVRVQTSGSNAAAAWASDTSFLL